MAACDFLDISMIYLSWDDDPLARGEKRQTGDHHPMVNKKENPFAIMT